MNTPKSIVGLVYCFAHAAMEESKLFKFKGLLTRRQQRKLGQLGESYYNKKKFQLAMANKHEESAISPDTAIIPQRKHVML